MSELDERCPDCGRLVAYTVCDGHPQDRYNYFEVDYDPRADEDDL